MLIEVFPCLGSFVTFEQWFYCYFICNTCYIWLVRYDNKVICCKVQLCLLPIKVILTQNQISIRCGMLKKEIYALCIISMKRSPQFLLFDKVPTCKYFLNQLFADIAFPAGHLFVSLMARNVLVPNVGILEIAMEILLS